MSYQVLARKWRPKSFEELVGQSHVVTVLTNALIQQRLHHAYLFTGTRGVGKTTIARIFAKSLNCQLGITATPCGKCDACVDIDQGHFVDLIEIDAASRTKVDDTREILDNVQYAPTRGRYKVYLIDEVHMLSRSSFNALLKTLEEPPAHVKFILATTDPQKLPVTVLSRCLQFHLKALTIADIESKVKEILACETITYEDEAISLLAKAAKGSMRDCLSLTDQSIAQGSGEILRVNVQKMLGGVDKDWVFKILISLLKKDASALMSLSLDIASYSPSYSQLSAELLQLLHQVAMAQVVDSNFNHMGNHQKLFENFCQLLSPEDVQLFYQIVLNARKDLPYAADEQAAFDMMLLRLLAFNPVANKQELPTNAELHSAELAPSLISDDVTASNEHSIENIPAISQSPEQNVEELTGKSCIKPLTPSKEVTNELNSDGIKDAADSANVDHEAKTAEAFHEQLSNEMLVIEQQADSLQSEVPIDNNQQLSPQKPFIQHQQDGHQVDESSRASEQNQLSSPVAAAIATRNMLRSRKKSLEDSSKKQSDVITRQPKQESPVDEERVEVKPMVPELVVSSEQPYSADVIDPSKIRSANQVDKWANMIDNMSLTARLRQLAIHATIDDTSTDSMLILKLDQSIKHLNSDSAHKQLEQKLSQYLQKSITVELNLVEKTVADPYQIQADINVKRYNYAKQLLNEDEVVLAMQNHFQAELDQETIVAL